VSLFPWKGSLLFFTAVKDELIRGNQTVKQTKITADRICFQVLSREQIQTLILFADKDQIVFSWYIDLKSHAALLTDFEPAKVTNHLSKPNESAAGFEPAYPVLLLYPTELFPLRCSGNGNRTHDT